MPDGYQLPVSVLGAVGATVATAPLIATFADPARPLVLTGGFALIAAVLAGFVLPARSHPLSQAGAVIGTSCLAGIGAVELTLLATGLPAVGLPDAWAQMAGSWNATRGGALPAPLEPGLVALPVLLAVAAAWAAGLTARQVSSGLAAVPLLAGFGVALCFTGGEAAPLPTSFALLMVCLGLHLAPDQSRDRRAVDRGHRWRRRAIAVLVIAGVAVTVSTVVPGFADAGRTDLRGSFVPPLASRREPHVLNLVASGLSGRSAPPVVFEVQIDGQPGPAPDRARLAVLDDYDGTTWTSSGRFTVVEEPPADSATEARLVEQTYMLTRAFESTYIPAIDRPVTFQSLTSDDIGRDPESDTLALLRDSEAEVRYRVTSNRPDPQLRAQARRQAPDPTSHPLDPDHADELDDYLATLPTGGSPYDTLAAIEQDMRSPRFGYDPDAAAGHSIGRLAQFLGVSDSPAVPSADRTGTSEQPAAAFAVLARMLGYEARVVVGYDLPAAAYRSERPAKVTANRIYAWAEVRFGSLGWIAFDPTDPTPRRPSTQPPDTAVAPQPQTSLPPTTQAKWGGVDEPPDDETDWRKLGLGLGALLIVGLLALVGVAVGRRARRALRRRRGSAELRVVRAWAETKDFLRGRGLVVTPAATPADVASACRRRAGSESDSTPATRVIGPDLVVPERWAEDLCSRLADTFDRLGPVLDTTLYAPAEPTDNLARKAWAIDDDVRAAFARRVRRRPGPERIAHADR